LVLKLHLGDTVRLKKAHPCGSYEWEVARLGADIGLVCLGCGRRTMLRRSRLEQRLQELTARPRPES
jgi:hypothetical protein